MSFSREVKEELASQFSGGRHCRIAEFAAIFSLCGKIVCRPSGRVFLKIHTENLTVAKKSFILIKKTFGAQAEVSVLHNVQVKKSNTYILYVREQERVKSILKSIKMMDEEGNIISGRSTVDRRLIQNVCCRRAYIRGTFLVAGSVTDPEKAYHLEIAVTNKNKAKDLQSIIASLEMDVKIAIRKKYYVLYVKEGSQIVDFLNNMEAHVALMNFENVRIVKEVRNSVNRQVNCETANINKTVTAAARQIEDIKYIRNTVGFGDLTDSLRQTAELRLEYVEASLQELGAMLSPPIGKSGVNHRLRKLGEIAERLRTKKEETFK